MRLTEAQFRELERRLASKAHPVNADSVPVANGQPAAVEPSLFGLSLLVPELEAIHGMIARVKSVQRVTVKVKPLGAPRQTRRDAWSPRQCVLRYRELRDAIRQAAGQVDRQAGLIYVRFFIPMPGSWSEAKKRMMDGQFHQSRPDTDNLYKAFSDAILEQDGVVFLVLACKVWCRAGAERIEATIASF
jgi:Holliday junction resolvase RusA-like endonuclease